MKIGRVELAHALALAPMAGVTDYSFRKICAAYGAEYAVSEMVSAKAMHYKDRKTASLAYIREDEDALAIQLFGNEPAIMAEAAGMLCDLSYAYCISRRAPVAIDINAGCPVKKITSNGEGSALMKNPSLIYDIVKAVNDASSVPVTVKIRTGYDKEHINAVECAKAAEEAGAYMICVHGRTREQMYSPPVDLDTIAAVKEAVRVPVMGNGGVYTPRDALKMLEYTRCDGIMIGQGALGNPFVFENIIRALEGREEREIPVSERVSVMKEHLASLIKEKGSIIGVCEARKHLGWYSAGMRDSAVFRERINRAENENEMRKLIEIYFEEGEEA